MIEQKILQEFVNNAVLHGIYTNNGDYKLCNKASKKLLAIIKPLEKDELAAQEFINELLHNEDPSVIIWLSVLVSKVNYKKEVFHQKLKTISSNKSLKLISFSANKMLDEWFENAE